MNRFLKHFLSVYEQQINDTPSHNTWLIYWCLYLFNFRDNAYVLMYYVSNQNGMPRIFNKRATRIIQTLRNVRQVFWLYALFFDKNTGYS